MSDETEELILKHLRAISDKLDGISQSLSSLNGRTASIERKLIALQGGVPDPAGERKEPPAGSRRLH